MPIAWSMERLRSLLLGINFTLLTDCLVLLSLNSKRTLEPQIALWYIILMEYNVTIIFRSGEKLVHIDTLSRAPVEADDAMLENLDSKTFGIFAILEEADRVLMMKRHAEDLTEFIDILKKTMEKRSTQEKKE